MTEQTVDEPYVLRMYAHIDPWDRHFSTWVMSGRRWEDVLKLRYASGAPYAYRIAEDLLILLGRPVELDDRSDEIRLEVRR